MDTQTLRMYEAKATVDGLRDALARAEQVYGEACADMLTRDREPKASWHYALARKSVQSEIESGESWQIVEVYLDARGELSNWSDAKEPFGETWQETLNDLARMSRAGERQFLDLDQQPPVLVDLPRRQREST